ncbi:hypothetical protein AURDEDRAFT_68835 [Auricularia subglabra TFB-10046 SS5]|uniref:DUF6589 domain-containing protein n=1 Tax=Auricularia subglabra (strain TFB-10046 / SS5) TaxID=717982 RepID=J0LKD5_AURST|nr:hypothetical protein AURDEDRAFT_68835 [Auricularia subglabra TFB-10046 SS5]
MQSASASSTPRIRNPRRNDVQKLDDILDEVQKAGWSLGQFLYLLFQHPTLHMRSEKHRVMLSKFLRGQNFNKSRTNDPPYRPSLVVDLMHKHPYGRPGSQSDEDCLDFSVDKPHMDVQHARPAISCWAASLCAERIEKEAKKATQPDAGLHAQTKCPLLWTFMVRAGSKKRRPGLVAVKRSYRPVETVVTAALSDVLFSRNQGANLLQLARGIALFATRAEASIYRVGSRFGNNPVYNTVSHALETMAASGQQWLRDMAASEVDWLMLVVDNVQHYLRQREIRFGRENTMIKGITGTGIGLSGASADAWDLDSLLCARLGDSRYDLKPLDLLAKIDWAHLERMFQLHWLDVLITHVPALASYRHELDEMFAACAKELRLPEEHRSEIQPLQSSSHDPAKTTEMAAAVFDIFKKQLDQTPEKWKRRAVFVGGDGGTYEGLLRLQKYLQTQDNEYERMDWLVPILQLWHMKWAVLGRIFNNWWGSSTSSDASCLGHSATAAGKPTPSNLKKPDFNSASETLFLVGESRMMDCWSVILGVDDVQDHFEQQKATGKLQSLQDLLPLALKLHRTYSSTRGALQALEPYDHQGEAYRAALTKNAEWLLGVAPAAETSDASQSHDTPGAAPGAANSTTTSERETVSAKFEEAAGFLGDRSLANSINGLCDFLSYRHWCRSTSIGWIGDVWEVVKACTFPILRSGHNPKYTSFGLEMFIMLEFEAPAALKDAILRSLLVNPSGRRGHYKECDLMQEHLINRLDRVMQNQDKSYDDKFIKQVVSSNLDSLSEFPRQLEAAVELSARSQAHKPMHQRPEARRLQDTFRKTGVHRFHPGRSDGFASREAYGSGIAALQGGVLDEFLETHRRETNVFTRKWSAADAENAALAEKNAALFQELMQQPEYSPDEELGPPASGVRPAIFFGDEGLYMETDAGNADDETNMDGGDVSESMSDDDDMYVDD